MLDALPPAKTLFADRSYDADWFRSARIAKVTAPCIPPQTNRRILIPHHRVLYRQRHRIENRFGKLKGWRRIHTLVHGGDKPGQWIVGGVPMRYMARPKTTISGASVASLALAMLLKATAVPKAVTPQSLVARKNCRCMAIQPSSRTPRRVR